MCVGVCLNNKKETPHSNKNVFLCLTWGSQKLVYTISIQGMVTGLF